MATETIYSEVDKLLNDYYELRVAAADLLMAQNEYYDKAQGYRHGGASISEWTVATKELEEARQKLHKLVFKPIND